MTEDVSLDFLTGDNLGERVRDLLEDFDIVATPVEVTLLSRHAYNKALKTNIHAAIVSYSLGLSSLDYTKRRYANVDWPEQDDALLDAYVGAYQAGKRYVRSMIAKLVTTERPNPEFGVFGAALVLERLPVSFFSAHVLFRLGHRYEGHAVARLILEQIAWAHTAYQLKEIERIRNIVTTKTIGSLSRFAPWSGRLYGFLSSKTHIDYRNHLEFLSTESGRNAVRHAQQEFLEYGVVMLHLADLFGIVWELSQSGYLDTLEAVKANATGYEVNPDRPFAIIREDCLKKLKEATARSKKRGKRTQERTGPHAKAVRRRPNATRKKSMS